MPILGAHMSIAGGYYKAVEAAVELGMDCVQIFTKNNNQWRAKPLGEEEAEAVRSAFEQADLQASLSHASYLINLASPKDDLWEKSIEAMCVELRRAEKLGVPQVVVHPGAFTTSDEETGIRRIAAAIDRIYQKEDDCETTCLLETTAGQGSCLGWRFEQLQAMLDAAEEKDRVAVCLDTCHVFAAGYPLAPRAEFDATFQRFDDLIGLERLLAIHVNDSRSDLGTRVDRHEHIGDGHLGEEPFRLLVNDPRFDQIPMYLETAKEDAPDGRPWDAVNLERLRGFVRARPTDSAAQRS